MSSETGEDPGRGRILAVGVGKRYAIYARPRDRLARALRRGRGAVPREFWALRGVSFEVEPGGALGIVGRNGSGKSTLLQIIAGTMAPTEGSVEVGGRVAALLELGSGFNPEFTGRENAYLNGAILGLSRREMDARMEEIAAFADIGAFLDQPVKVYSSGMLVRLAFAVQVQVEPDILIVDEALAVGDALFQKRCYQRLEEMRSGGVTLLFVSHDQESVRTLTSRAVLLHEGSVRASGSSAEVLLEYRRLLHEDEKRWLGAQVQRIGEAARGPSPAARDGERPDRLSFGDLDAEVTGVRVLDASGEESEVFYPGDEIVIRVECLVRRALTHLNVAVRLRSKEGVKMYSWGTLNQDIARWAGRGAVAGGAFWERRFQGGERVTIDFRMACALGMNLYEVQACVTEEGDRFYGSQRMLHWRDEAAFFQVYMKHQEYFFGGVCDLRMSAHVQD